MNKFVKIIVIAASILLPFNGNSQNKNSKIKLDFFKEYPGESDGRSLFTYDNIPIFKGTNIFGYGNKGMGRASHALPAVIKVNGKFVYLKRTQYEKSTNKFVFEGEGYTATIVEKLDKMEGETSIYTGTLEITKGNSHVKFNIHGYGGE